MSRVVLALSAAAVFALSASSATAAVLITADAPGVNLGPAGNETQVINFDAGLPLGAVLSGVANLVVGDAANAYKAPLGDGSTYLAAGDGPNGGAAQLNVSGLLGLTRVGEFSFYWGSIDTWNTLELLDRSGSTIFTLSGAAAAEIAHGASDARFHFQLTDGSQDLGALRFISSRPAFEVDDIAFSSAVPEPTSWLIWLVGFVGLGSCLRTRQRRLRRASVAA